MTIIYANPKIQLLFSDLENVAGSKKLLQKQIGIDLTRMSKTRMKQLKAARFFKNYLDNHIGNPHSLEGNLNTFYGVDLNAHIRLIIQPVPPDLSPEALKICEIVNIIGIVDYHGGKNEWLIA